jgi:biotin synthase
MEIISQLKQRVLNGGSITYEEALELLHSEDKEALYAAAEEITKNMVPKTFDSCSIVNARSGKCSENCKWCAQSAHYHTGCETYDLIDHDKCMESARMNARAGVRRFSLVASGRSVKGKALTAVCSMLREAKEETGIFTCASLGLLNEQELQELWDAGVRRYPCNLETAPSYFSKMCTTHTIEDKIKTIKAAKRIGFQVCSGGIIGMGETPEQRIEFGFKLLEVEPHSIPVNILCQIPGTPLADNAPITDDEFLTTVAIFRFIHPKTEIRFAGGRAHLSKEVQMRALKIAVNGGVVGDLLTTIGSKTDEDRQMVEKAGYEF